MYSFLSIYFSNTISTSFVLVIGWKGAVTYQKEISGGGEVQGDLKWDRFNEIQSLCLVK